MRGYVAYQLVGCGLGHSLVGTLAGVQVVATVEAIGKGLGIGGAAHGSIKIDATIEDGRCAQPLVKLLSHSVAFVVIGTPAVDGQQRTAPHLKPHGLGGTYVDILYAALHLFNGGQVAPGTEGVNILANGVDDIIDAVLDDDIGSTGHTHLNGESGGTLQTVSLIGNAIVLAQYARATDGATDNGHVGAKGQLGQVIGPRLGGN